MLYHRAPAFVELYERVLAKLPNVFQTENDVLVFAASGSGAMESAAANLVRPGTPVLAAAAGKFGERWLELARPTATRSSATSRAGASASTPPSSTACWARTTGIEVAFATLSETSTGVVHDVQAIAEVCKRHDVILAVDAVSGLGAAELRQDEWGDRRGRRRLAEGADVPARPRLRERLPARRSTTPPQQPGGRYYFDWGKNLKAQRESNSRRSRPPCRSSSASTSRST